MNDDCYGRWKDYNDNLCRLFIVWQAATKMGEGEEKAEEHSQSRGKASTADYITKGSGQLRNLVEAET